MKLAARHVEENIVKEIESERERERDKKVKQLLLSDFFFFFCIWIYIKYLIMRKKNPSELQFKPDLPNSFITYLF